MIQQTLTHASFYKPLTPDSNLPEEPKSCGRLFNNAAFSLTLTLSQRERAGARENASLGQMATEFPKPL
jgi:hypothetical protein